MLTDVIKQVWDLKVLSGLWPGHVTDWLKPGDGGTACSPHASGMLELISRQPPGSFFARMGVCRAGLSLGRELLWEWMAIKGTITCPSGTRRRHFQLASSLAETNRMCSSSTPKYSWWQKKPFHGTFSGLPGGRSRGTMSHIIWAVLRGYRDGEFRIQ